MANRNKMVEGMLIGAVIGAAVSLFDKETRDIAIRNGKVLTSKTIDIIKNPEVVTGKIRDNIRMVRTTIDEVTEDIQFLATKVHELNEKTPEMIEMINDTKEAFSKTLHRDGDVETK